MKATAEKNLVKVTEIFLKEKIQNEFLNVKVNELNVDLDFEYKDYTMFDWVGETDILNRVHKLYGLGCFNNEVIKFTLQDEKGAELFTIKL